MSHNKKQCKWCQIIWETKQHLLCKICWRKFNVNIKG